MTTPTLVLLPISPWSERVRWAFDHHRLAYDTVVHMPVIGERRLRRLVGKRDKPATVPVLIDGATTLTESWDIARHADSLGAAPPLFPADRVDDIRRWNDLADRTMSGARVLAVTGMLHNPAALDETLPPNVPAWLRRTIRPINRLGVQWFGRKYGVENHDTASAEASLRATLTQLRAALDGREYVLGSFTYADIAAATLLQGIAPVADTYLRLGPATRQVWTHPVLAAEFADLVRWRDELYRKHRRPL